MSTHVVAFKPADSKWRLMKAVYDSCQAAGVEVPDAVGRFFYWSEPDEQGVEIDEGTLMKVGAVRHWHDASQDGFEIDVSKLPPDVTIVRFYNSW